MAVPSIFVILFMAAQGIAIFGTAAVLADFSGLTRWWGKVLWIAVSYVGWVAFTFGLFVVLGADVFIIPFAGSAMALIPTSIALLLWVAVPLFRERARG